MIRAWLKPSMRAAMTYSLSRSHQHLAADDAGEGDPDHQREGKIEIADRGVRACRRWRSPARRTETPRGYRRCADHAVDHAAEIAGDGADDRADDERQQRRRSTAICRSTLPAASTRASMSRPRLSVPNQWTAFGGCSAWPKSTFERIERQQQRCAPDRDEQQASMISAGSERAVRSALPATGLGAALRRSLQADPRDR